MNLQIEIGSSAGTLHTRNRQAGTSVPDAVPHQLILILIERYLGSCCCREMERGGASVWTIAALSAAAGSLTTLAALRIYYASRREHGANSSSRDATSRNSSELHTHFLPPVPRRIDPYDPSPREE